MLETLLDSLGVGHKLSRPYHPQTCRKVERFHQTLKKYLRRHPAASLTELQAHLECFVSYYNDVRPHRALGRRTPREVFESKAKAHPENGPEFATHFRVRQDRVDTAGKVTLRYESRLRHIGLGRAHAGRKINLLVADRDVRVIDAATGELIRALTIGPSRNYQAMEST